MKGQVTVATSLIPADKRHVGERFTRDSREWTVVSMNGESSEVLNEELKGLLEMVPPRQIVPLD